MQTHGQGVPYQRDCVPSPAPTEPLLVRAAQGLEQRKAAEKSARLLVMRADDEIGTKVRIVRMLWRSGDRVQMAMAKLLVWYFKTSTGQFTKPTELKPKRVVECRIMATGGQRKKALVPRKEIALNVFLLLEPGPGSLLERKLGKAIKDTALFFDITDKQVRDCFNECREDLLQFGDLITWS